MGVDELQVVISTRTKVNTEIKKTKERQNRREGGPVRIPPPPSAATSMPDKSQVSVPFHKS